MYQSRVLARKYESDPLDLQKTAVQQAPISELDFVLTVPPLNKAMWRQTSGNGGGEGEGQK